MGDPARIDVRLNVHEAGGGASVNALKDSRIENSVINIYGATRAEPRREFSPPAASRVFVGRAELLAAVVEELEARGRLLLHGMPGIGKTVLAAQAAQVVHGAEAFGDGILWVSDIGSSSPEVVCDAIARRLGDEAVPRHSGAAKLDATRDLLEPYESLLVILDHVDEGPTAERLLDIALPSGVAVLATSQHRHPWFDTDFDVPPLAPPAAAELFEATAHVGGPDAGPVAAVCALLDYHPLAIVVAASRVRIEDMPLARLQERLEASALEALRADETTTANRIRASLQLSIGRLDEPQLRSLQHLAACFDRSAGLGFLAKSSDLDSGECEDRLGLLIRCSLVEREADRFRLQRLVREYVRDLAEDDLPALEGSAVLAAVTLAQAHTGADVADHDALEAELPNLIGAARYANAVEDWPALFRIAEVLVRPVSGVLGARGYWTVQTEIGNLGIDAARSTGDQSRLGWFLYNTAVIQQARGEFAQARALYQSSSEIYEALDKPWVKAKTLHNVGSIARQEGDLATARTNLSRSLEMKEQLSAGQPQRQADLATTLHELGLLAAAEGDLPAARDYFERSAEVDEQSGDVAGLAENQRELGVLAHIEGDLATAEALYSQSLEECLAARRKSGIARAWLCSGCLHLDTGDLASASDLVTQSLETSKSLGDQPAVGDALLPLADLAHQQGDDAVALRHLDQALTIANAVGLPDLAVLAGCRAAAVATEAGQLETAERHLGQAGQRLHPQSGWLARATYFLQCGLTRASSDAPEAEQQLRASLAVCEEVGYRRGMAEAQLGLGRLALDAGDRVEAETLLGASRDTFAALRSPRAADVEALLAT